MNKRIITFLLSLVLLVGFTGEVFAAQYTDVIEENDCSVYIVSQDALNNLISSYSNKTRKTTEDYLIEKVSYVCNFTREKMKN